MSEVNWSDPYSAAEGPWLKGNLHTHTSQGSACGRILPQECLDLYVELGHDFLAISDHKSYTQVCDDRLTILPGVEWNASSGGRHTGVYSLAEADLEAAIAETDQVRLLSGLEGTAALVILNHPNWQLVPHYRREQLDELSGYHGIEIYNGVIEGLQGYAIATDKWDYLLARGKRVLGFASDDSHSSDEIGRAAIYVRAKSRSASEIVSAIKAGSFYCSSGALIDDVRRRGSVIEIETPDAQEITVVSDGGTCIRRVRDRSLKLDARKIDASYVRFEAYGAGSAMAWTQPFFLKP